MKTEKTTRVRSVTADICLNGLLVALVLAATMFINIRLPISVNGGLIHLGNVPLVAAAIVFGRRKGAIAGAFGMGLFDLLSGWTLWAPFTFVVRGAMGWVIGKISETRGGKSFVANLLAVTVGGAIMVAGYYVTEVILYGNFVAPVTSIPGNLIQVLTALVIGLPLSTALKKTGIV
ncbi:MAG: ECF transporter S component [Oscillospiraceae bacterium]|jgi:uncharacterized membrane protein|nr:ECF transporter S component [Oscillospiraceae bacterium]